MEVVVRKEPQQQSTGLQRPTPRPLLLAYFTFDPVCCQVHGRWENMKITDIYIHTKVLTKPRQQAILTTGFAMEQTISFPLLSPPPN